MTVCQKLGVILESGSKIEFRKKVFNKYRFPKLIFLDKFFFLKKFD